jgi:hypothetical protein
MSKNALKPLGIGTFDDPKFTPTKGIIIDIPKAEYPELKKQVQVYLHSLGDTGFWKAGGGGSFDPEHPDQVEIDPDTGKPYGTTKEVSGDIDVFMDSDLIKKKLGLDPKLSDVDVKSEVLAHAQKHYPSVKGGNGIHLAWPAPGKTKGMPNYYQIDLMIMQDAHGIGEHHMHSYRHKNSPYKGVDQQLAMSSLINSHPSYEPKELQYHGFGGAVKHRASKQVLSPDNKQRYTDIIHSAELALGPGATWRNISSVEDIIKWFEKEGGIEHPRLAQLKADLERKKAEISKKSVKEGSSDWFRIISQNLTI